MELLTYTIFLFIIVMAVGAVVEVAAGAVVVEALDRVIIGSRTHSGQLGEA